MRNEYCRIIAVRGKSRLLRMISIRIANHRRIRFQKMIVVEVDSCRIASRRGGRLRRCRTGCRDAMRGGLCDDDGYFLMMLSWCCRQLQFVN